MKTRIILIVILFSFVAVANIYAKSKSIKPAPSQEAVEQSFSNVEDFKLSFNKADDCENYLQKIFKKRKDEIQANQFLVEKVTEYKTDGSKDIYTYSYDAKANLLILLHETIDNYQRSTFTRLSYKYEFEGNQITSLTLLSESNNSGEWCNDKRETMQYDLNGNSLSHSVELWNGEEWFYDSISIDNYDSQGNNTCYYTYYSKSNQRNYSYQDWHDGQWINENRISFSYDLNGNQLTLKSEYWKDEQWNLYCNYSYTYDTNGNMILQVYESVDDNSTVYRYRKSYTYDSIGNKLTELYEAYENEQWIKVYRNSYSYDLSGYPLTFLYEVWYNEQWVISCCYSFTLDSLGNLLTQLYEEWEDTQLVSGSRLSFAYDLKGNILSELFEAFENGQWTNKTQKSYIYDINSNLTTFLSYYFDDKNNQWIEMDGIVDFKDSENNGFVSYGYRVEINWTSIFVSVDDNTKQQENFSVTAYPNPFSQSTNIRYELHTANQVKIDIFNSIGEKVTTLVDKWQEAGIYNTTFNQNIASSQFQEGLYFYRIQIGETIESGKLLLIK